MTWKFLYVCMCVGSSYAHGNAFTYIFTCIRVCVNVCLFVCLYMYVFEKIFELGMCRYAAKQCLVSLSIMGRFSRDSRKSTRSIVVSLCLCNIYTERINHKTKENTKNIHSFQSNNTLQKKMV